METMLDVTRDRLETYKALTPGVNEHIQNIINAIPFTTVPTQMKAVIALSQLVSFASQFRRNILLWDDDTEVPVNSISFVIAGSGGNKDSSVDKARKCFRTGYEMLEKERYNRVVADAIKAAEDAEEECPTEFSVYRDYMKDIPPLDISPSTGPGLVKHVNELAKLPIGAGIMYSGEFSDELAHNGEMSEIIKVLSELFDLGVKAAVYTKGADSRVSAVRGQPMSALLVGSPGHLLYDMAVRKKFEVAFMSKLARRANFCYVPQMLPEPDFMNHNDPIEAADEFNAKVERVSKNSIAAYNVLVESVTTFHLPRVGTPITLEPNILKLFNLYKRYNSDLADTYTSQDSTTVLIRRHLQWKALKMAGGFAIMDMSDVVTEDHYLDAIRFCEMLDKDMDNFERDLNKASHELFADYMRSLVAADGKATINVHELKKRGYLLTVSSAKLQELCTLAAGYDVGGIYTVIGTGSAIQYEAIIKTDTVTVSFKPIDNSALNRALEAGDKEGADKAKHAVAATVAYGFDCVNLVFNDLKDMLAEDLAYSPFEYKDGIRGRNNLVGGTKWLVFDIDRSPLTASEVHVMLSDINHHVALSSNPNNEYKFRVLLELDSVVDITATEWKYFCKYIAEFLALDADPLPQAQVFFSYAGRDVYSQTDAEPLEVRDFVMKAVESVASKVPTKKPTTAQSKAALLDPMNTFNYAYDATEGDRSRSLIRAVYHAKDLGIDLEGAKELITDINNYWYLPISDLRMERLYEQLGGMF